MYQIDSASPHRQHHASVAKQPGSTPGKLCMTHSHNGLLNTHQIASLALIMVTFGNRRTGGRPTSEMITFGNRRIGGRPTSEMMQDFCRKVAGQRLSLDIIGEVDLQVWQMGSFK